MADKWEWEAELKQAHLTQSDVANVIGLSKSQMSHLVKKMIAGQGLIASELDKKRWKSAIEYVQFKQSQLQREN
ncbi:MarR family transcriptional regulator [Levilactobacillus brevis]|uniref:MarR family transcriptional regulator n=1 Tax=Levilactobacillus brevis TaxID=1580 RepID=UPI002165BF4E|nr:helix-turn-helix domain-containing protein [Levilactobacillus brevis]UVW17969.1 MarR family transcriptional regulator [Levilactobacillus brevis]